MVDATYRIVEHDGGWAYKLGDVFSETYPTRASAEAAAARVAAEQRVPGDTEAISWQDENGVWHDEIEDGSDRPNAYVSADTDLRRAPNAALGALSARVGDRPLGAVLLALAAGYVLAVLIGRASRRR